LRIFFPYFAVKIFVFLAVSVDATPSHGVA
jgi:hypothetical protein